MALQLVPANNTAPSFSCSARNQPAGRHLGPACQAVRKAVSVKQMLQNPRSPLMDQSQAAVRLQLVTAGNTQAILSSLPALSRACTCILPASYPPVASSCSRSPLLAVSKKIKKETTPLVKACVEKMMLLRHKPVSNITVTRRYRRYRQSAPNGPGVIQLHGSYKATNY